MKRIQLAIGNDDFANILRMHLVEAGFDVLANDAYHRNFLVDLLELEQPNMVILHDTFLPSETETQVANEQELLQMLNTFRMQYNDSMRFVVLSEREKNDPFLRSLVAHNVLDIFAGRQIPTVVLIEQLSEPPKYQNVAKLGVGQLVELLNEKSTVDEEEDIAENISGTEVDNARSFDVRETLLKSKDLLLKFNKHRKTKNGAPLQIETVNDEEQKEPEQKELDTPQKVEQKKTTVPDESPRFQQSRMEHRKVKKGKPKESTSASGNVTISPSVIVKDRFIGTVFLAVTSLGANVGATHTSIMLAAYLQRNGYKVALIEGNRSGDFNRLHELFGETGTTMQQPFRIHNIDHYSYIDEEGYQPYFHDYQFVIMDLGNAQTSPWFNEFFRAQKRLLIAGYADWKLALIGSFIKKHGKIPFQVVVPFGDQELITDLHEIYEENTIFSAMPFHRNPYEAQTDTQAVLSKIFGQMIGEKAHKPKRKGLWVAVASLLAVAAMGLSFIILS